MLKINYINRSRPSPLFSFALFALASLSLVYAVFYSENALFSALSSLKRASLSLVPALFCSSCASHMLISLPLPPSPLFRIPARLFGISEKSAVALLFGLLCGNPIGALLCAENYKNGCADARESARVLACSCCPSPSFCIGLLGSAFLGSAKLGALIYALCVLCNLAFLAATRQRKVLPKAPPVQESFSAPALQIICESIQKGGAAMITASAFAVFFSVFADSVLCILLPFLKDPRACACIKGFFELSTGARALSSLSFPLCAVLSGALCGWAGLSVHMQIAQAARGIPLRLFFLCRVVCSAALALSVLLVLALV